MSQGFHEAPDPVTGKASEHVRNALKDKNDLSNAEVVPSGNFMKSPLRRKPEGYWSEDNTVFELESVIKEIGYFPVEKELRKMKKNGLIRAINKNGGFPRFRDSLGFKVIKHSNGYWSEEIIISKVSQIINEIGHFPTRVELNTLGVGDLSRAMSRHGGSNHFRKLLKHIFKKKPNNFWSEEVIIIELELFMKSFGHFPSQSELVKTKRGDLSTQITRFGGFAHFKEKTGFTISMQEKYRSGLSLYVGKRGRKSEKVIKEIITEWSNIHGKPLPDLNVKLAKGNVLEFVCDFNKKIGIDVTNTKGSLHSAFYTIRNKWKHKDYHLYLDELWIVVFTDVLSSEDYNKLNMICPKNVKIFSIEGFLKELDYSIEQRNMNEIDKLQRCTFHNKEEMIAINKATGG